MFSPFLFALAAAQFAVNDRAISVQLFEWKFTDIARECKEFLGPKGFSFVSVSPVQAHSSQNFAGGPPNPWYLSYQPLGFKIGNRLGTEQEFQDMVNTCKNASVDVVVDVIFNHLVGVGQTGKGGYGSDASWVSKPFAENFPDSGFTAEHFNDNLCNRKIADNEWSDDWKVQTCRLVDLADFKTDHPYVRAKTVEFLNKLIDMGVSGFRIDASKHIPFADVDYIFSRLKNTYAGRKPYITQEIFYAIGSTNDYQNFPQLGRVLNFDYAQRIGQYFRNRDGKTIDRLANEFNFFKLSSGASTTFIENHDVERRIDGFQNYALFHVNGGWWYKQAIAFNILYPWGISTIHSGFTFKYLADEVQDVYMSPTDSKGYVLPMGPIIDNKCPSTYQCQHRLSDVYPLVKVRNHMGAPQVTIQSAGTNRIHWNVPGKAFVAFNSAQGGIGNEDFIQSVFTGLEPGVYCNMLYGYASGQSCVKWPGVELNNQEQIAYTVDSNKMTTVRIRASDKSRVLALYSAADGVWSSTTDPVTTSVSITTLPATTTVVQSTTTSSSTPTPPSGVIVNFSVSGVSTTVGQNIVVAGSIPQLGSWITTGALKLAATNCQGSVCVWSGSVNIPAGTAASWKAVLVNGSTARWQCGDNNSFTASSPVNNVNLANARIC